MWWNNSSLLSRSLIQVVLQLEKKLFSYVNQDVFRENNGTPVGRAPLNGVSVLSTAVKTTSSSLTYRKVGRALLSRRSLSSLVSEVS